MDAEREIPALLDALAQSPENVPLRRHLAEVYLAHGRTAEAVDCLKEALRLTPGDVELKRALAEAYRRDGKLPTALVIAEDLIKQGQGSGAAHLLHARLLLEQGDVDAASRAYRRALDEDAELADPSLARRLGLGRESAVEDEDETVDGRIRQRSGGGRAGGPPVELERPRIGFDDVGGMAALKEEIRLKIIHPLAHPEIYRAYGKAVGGGVLLYGPPGCGKTHLARATAGEIKSGFISVGIHAVLDMWLGQSERNLHEVFEQARRSAPCVLFFDEVDALGASRSDMRASGGRHLINQFLAELDGADRPNEGVLILAASNAPWHLDTAFRRPGRFDRLLFVTPPDGPGRAAILRVLLRGKPQEDVAFEDLASKTEGFSGADLKGLVDLAVESKLSEALRSGKPEPLTTRDLKAAARSVKPSTREWFATARNYALYANQGGLYDPIKEYLGL